LRSYLVDRANRAVRERDLAALPVERCEVELLITGGDADTVTKGAVTLCDRAFGTRTALQASLNSKVRIITRRTRRPRHDFKNSNMGGAASTQVSKRLKCFASPAARASPARSQASSGQGGSMTV
jgi:hypothetical protein